MVIFQIPSGIPEHNLLGNKIGNYLAQHRSHELVVLYDTYCNVTAEMLERLGHFKGGDPHEYMQQRLLDFGASPTFIAETMAHLVKQGIMPSSYAPDVCVVHEADFENRFRIPLWIGEIASKDSRDYDLYFKPYLYERLGVKEYFVFETGRRSGRLIKTYRLKPEKTRFGQYEEISFTEKAARSDALGTDIPVQWTV